MGCLTSISHRHIVRPAYITASLCVAILLPFSCQADDSMPLRLSDPVQLSVLSGRKCVRVSPNGSVALAQEGEGWVLIKLREEQDSPKPLEDGPVAGVADFSPDSTRVAFWSSSKELVIRATSDGKVTSKHPFMFSRRPPLLCRWSSSSRQIALAFSERIVVIDVDDATVREIPGAEGHWSCLSWDPDGSRIAAGCWSGRFGLGIFDRKGDVGPKPLVRVWDDADQLIRYSAKDHPGTVTSVSFSADGSRIAGSSRYIGDSSKVWQWDASGRLLRVSLLKGLEINDLVCGGEEGKFVLCVGYEKVERRKIPVVTLIDIVSGEVADMSRREFNHVHIVGATSSAADLQIFTYELKHKAHPLQCETFQWTVSAP